ncbi:MAG TPA: single-stranded DNA-binding protein, partial [Campylobacterales bacterium]|nr:single-stranded DNA-binding protein [Campylobacterales bacterium]
MYNKVVLVGHLTRDVEIRYSQGGSAIGKVGIATSRKWKSQTGEQKDEVMFIDLTFFGRTAEIANQYLRKGSKVLVDGRLVFEQWTAQDGTKRSKHAIVVETMKMLDTKADSQNPNYNNGYGNQPTQNSYGGMPQQSQPTQNSSYGGGYNNPPQQQQ